MLFQQVSVSRNRGVARLLSSESNRKPASVGRCALAHSRRAHARTHERRQLARPLAAPAEAGA